MFFTLSKLLNFLTNPLVLVLALLLFSIFTKRARRKKFSFWVGLSLLIFFSNDFIANEAMSAWEVPPTPFTEMTKTYSWGIVLTGGAPMSKMPDDRAHFRQAADRVVNAVELYKKGILKKILISGGSGRLVVTGVNEAEEYLKAMVVMGVPSTDIIVEIESRNTHESAVNVKKLLEQESDGSCLLITSAFHMRRSEACFNKAGFKLDTFAGDFYTHSRIFTPDVLFIPNPNAIEIWQKLFKEWTGMVAYKVAGYV